MSTIVTDEDTIRRMIGAAVEAALATGDRRAPEAIDLGIEPGRFYDAREANALIGLGEVPRGKKPAIYAIPESDLPKRKVGAARGRVVYFGADLLAYVLGLPLPDVGPQIEEARRSLVARMAGPAPVEGRVGAGEAPGPRRRIA